VFQNASPTAATHKSDTNSHKRKKPLGTLTASSLGISGVTRIPGGDALAESHEVKERGEEVHLHPAITVRRSPASAGQRKERG
jgi:hypothetical protein